MKRFLTFLWVWLWLLPLNPAYAPIRIETGTVEGWSSSQTFLDVAQSSRANTTWNAVGAQATATLDEVHVHLWPEEDKPSVLVLYDIKASLGLPLTVDIPLPANADLNAVAREEGGMLVTVAHEMVGGGNAVRFTITDTATYRVEYYFPYEKSGIHRNFVYQWPGLYAVKNFQVTLKEPLGAQRLVTQPTLTDVTTVDNFTYHSLTFSNLPAGKPLEVSVEYDKANDALNIAKASPTAEPVTSKGSWLQWLPYGLGAIGALLIFLGVFFYWRSTTQVKKTTTSKRHTPAREQEKPTGVYCVKCGERARPGDRFCRLCGAKLPEG